MRSFLNSVIPEIRCQNPNCRAVPPVNNPITVQMLLYDGWMCRSCGEEYRGAMADPSLIPILPPIEGEELSDVIANVVESGARQGETSETLLPGSVGYEATKLERPKVLEDLKRAELVAELERFDLKLDDVPVTRGAVSNADIRAYLVSKVTTTN